MEYKTKCLIIGSGPAGCSAAVYAARASLDPIMVCGSTGGQLMITTDVENYPGFDSITGPELMQKMTSHAEKYGTKIIEDFIIDVDFSSRPFKCKSQNGDTYVANAIIISTGAEAKWLGLESEKKFQGFGVSGCAICDGFFFKNKVVAVVGGGNTAITEALYLTNHAAKVYLIHRRDEFKAEKVLQKRLHENKKIELVLDSVVDEIVGIEDNLGKMVTSVKLTNLKTNNKFTLDLNGVFIAIGHKPNTDIFKGKINMDHEGYILTTPGTTKTSVEGVFAAGDVQDKVYKQAITSAGTGAMAALDVEHFLSSGE